MSWLFKLLDSAGVNQAGVDANNNVKVNGPTTIAQTGFQGIAGRNDDGTITGTAYVQRGYVSEAQGQKIAVPAILWDDTFNATAQNTSKYFFAATTQTGAQSGGFLVLNNSAITTLNTNCGIRTQKVFPLFAKQELRCNISALFTVAPQANELYEWGLFLAVIPGAAAPTDGVFWRRNTSGELRGVISYAGVETQTAAITPPSVNVNHDYVIVCQTNTVRFYIDDILRASITLLTDAPTQGQPLMQASAPVCIRYVIGASIPGIASQIKVSDIFVTALGPDMVRDFPTAKAGFGHMAYQGQNGGTMGSTANYANSANPAAAVPTNTTAALGVGLGGQFWETVTLAANSDGIIQSFQNPVGAVGQTPRNLIVHGITVHAYNQVALATVAFNKQQSLAFGHTAVSLATVESASFLAGGTTKAPRRIALGVIQPIAAVNTVYPVMSYQFKTPIVIAPGEFIAFVSKNVGTVAATGVIAYNIAYDAYFE